MKATAKLRNYPTSPFKMRRLVDLVRGEKLATALVLLEHNPRPTAVPLRKLLLSVLSNWREKNPNEKEEDVVIQCIYVDGATSLKRMLPAPQGRAHRMQKRSLHIFVEVDSLAPKKEKPTEKPLADTIVATPKQATGTEKIGSEADTPTNTNL